MRKQRPPRADNDTPPTDYRTLSDRFQQHIRSAGLTASELKLLDTSEHLSPGQRVPLRPRAERAHLFDPETWGRLG